MKFGTLVQHGLNFSRPRKSQDIGIFVFLSILKIFSPFFEICNQIVTGFIQTFDATNYPLSHNFRIEIISISTPWRSEPSTHIQDAGTNSVRNTHRGLPRGMLCRMCVLRRIFHLVMAGQPTPQSGCAIAVLTSGRTSTWSITRRLPSSAATIFFSCSSVKGSRSAFRTREKSLRRSRSAQRLFSQKGQG